MPNSPYTKTVFPPIQDLGGFEQDLARHRIQFDDGENNKYAQEELLALGEPLLEHCYFLDEKLNHKVATYLIAIILVDSVDEIADAADPAYRNAKRISLLI